ncbi:hypothetical protein C7474_2026 [Microbacterium telephonicum]|uniref:Uncharacterized protein n=1 Tax=Microbacterium telephonicum TaxID=1714841 RepID=A0A498BU40_9MICO|nr:hypothetical protein C7474_2026 [Microbacterium telephonicum]
MIVPRSSRWAVGRRGFGERADVLDPKPVPAADPNRLAG